MAFMLFEDDGHNAPLLHKFRDQEQAERYLMRKGSDDTEMCVGFFDEEIEFTDNNFVNWSVTDGGVAEIDHEDNESEEDE